MNFNTAVIILTLIVLINSARILVVIPTPSISHHVVFRPVIQELIKRDHEVTFISPDPVYPKGGSNNLKEIDLHELSYTLLVKWFNGFQNVDQNDFLSTLTIAYELLSEIFEEQLKDNRVQQIIRNETMNFDLLIIEALVVPAVIFSHIFKAPVILMSSFGACPGNMEMIGAATHPFIYPMTFHRRLYNLTIFEKINELYQETLINRMMVKQEFEDNRLLKRLFGKNTLSLSELRKNVHILFLNVHPIWLHNQPIPPNVVYTWGIHKTPEKTLPEDLGSYLDSSANGTIYVSFGTNFNTSLLPSKTLEVMLKVLSRVNYNILWKWDTDELKGKSENIKIYRWLPQVDVLRHPKLKLFITQGGLQSTDEAIIAGVPVIGIPMMSDQEYNAEKYENFKIGIKLKLKTLTEELFENAINTILTKYDSYKKNIVHLRTVMQDTPKSPMENAIWWIEYVLRHGGARQLQTPAANMSWKEYYEIELIAVLIIGILFLILLLYLLYSTLIYLSRIILHNKHSFNIDKTKIS